MAKRSSPRSTRALAALAISPVLQGKTSLSHTLPLAQQACSAEDQGFLLELVHGTLRHAIYYRAIVQPLLQRAISDSRVEALILLGLHQLLAMRTPDHAALSETVEAAHELKLPKLSGFINAILRNVLRQQDALLQRAATQSHAHPDWLKQAIERDWPQQAEAILAANNATAPITLRVNQAVLERDAALAELDAQGIAAQPCAFSPVGIRVSNQGSLQKLDGLAQGRLSVQDEAAQLAATLLSPKAGERVLDACAAPGGKTAHLLELQPKMAALVAIDNDNERLKRVHSNIERVRMSGAAVIAPVTLTCAAAENTAAWWDGQLFDAILLDAPCTATGVIRRHPDIKLLRRPADVKNTVALQQSLLTALWPLLSPGGRLLYATCSVLQAENEQQVQRFCAEHSDALLAPIPSALHSMGLVRSHGLQLLPTEHGHDGFFYALITKTQ